MGITREDSQEDVDYLVRKIKNLRVFEDEAGKMNQSIEAIEGAILSISQFTLYGETKKKTVQALFKLPDLKWLHHCTKAFNAGLHAAGIEVATGRFGADMQVSLINDGPVTILIDTKEK